MLDAALAQRPEPDAPKHLRCGSHPGSGALPIGWRVCHTHPQQEDRALAELINQGFATFLPRYSARMPNRRHPRHIRFVSRPLFPSYLFVGWTERDKNWGSVLHTRGVHRLLEGVVPTTQIKALQATEALRRCPPPTHTLWRPGEAAQLNYGAFENVPVVLTSVSDTTDRVTVLMAMLGGLREIAVSTDCLSPRE